LVILTTIIGIILSRIPPRRKSKLDKEEQKLSIEEKKLHIELLKKEIEAKKLPEVNLNIENINFIINNNIKIIKHKSNFYKNLKNYSKVNQISTTNLDANGSKIEEPIFVLRKDFDKYILESDDLESITDENATIEIISPVLKKGQFKWKGIYNNIPSPIDFSMKDKEFKDKVVVEGIPFKNGTVIDCILEISRKIDDLGNVFNSNYSVLTVLRQHDEIASIETPQGKKYRRQKEADALQLKLLLFNPDNLTS
jgi:hypothetical protein